jgi:aflatoxin B1 aldehyde reductase
LKFFGKLDLHGSEFVDTKYFVTCVRTWPQVDPIFVLFRVWPIEPGYFAPENLRMVIHESLKALGPKKIGILYLHSPDRSDKHVPFEDTLREINEFHKAGHM